MSKLRRIPSWQTAAAVLTLAVSLVMAPTPSHAQADETFTQAANQPLAELCQAFDSASLPHGAKITETERRAARGTLPEVCIVRGSIVSSPASTINWAVELPAPSLWNGKTLTIGGGGTDGFIPTDSPWYQQLAGESANPFVKISSDSGHQTEGFGFALDDVALRNHAFEANHLSLEVGTQIAAEFYGKAPTRRYMFGHSNGGRSGLVATQRYPKDYDGVIALEPAIRQQGHQVNLIEVNRHVFGSPENWLSEEKIKLYARAETRACDALDGLEDGIIGNAQACDYVPTDLLCQGAENDACLTAGQIESIRLLYSDHHVPVKLADGYVGYPRFGRGGAATSDWKAYVFGDSFEARNAFNYRVSAEAARVVTKNPNVDYMTYDPTRYQAEWLRLSELIDATNPDLSAFAGNGGKLLIWHGVSDTCCGLHAVSEYYDSIKRFMGEENVREFSRLVTSPSVGHNLDGPGAAEHDWIATLDAWVERDVAPDNLVASKFESGSSAPVLQRPMCEFPRYPHYDGKGDPAAAASFTCMPPGPDNGKH